MGRMELRGILDRRFLQYRTTKINYALKVDEVLKSIEHMDDCLDASCERPFLVAVLALRVDWIHHLWDFHLHDWTDWRDIPHQFSRRQ